MYGAKFADAWRDVPDAVVKATWADALAGFTADEIKAGLNGCLQREWPPTLPEFIKLCRPQTDYQAAFEIAVAQMLKRDSGADKWPDAALFWAAAEIGSDLTGYKYDAVKSRWKRALDDARHLVAEGSLPNEVPKRAEALPAPKSTVTDEERARYIERLRIEI